MLERVFQDGRVLDRLRGGVLGSRLDDLAAYLGERGHSSQMVEKYVRAVGHFAHWLGRKGTAASSLGEGALRAFTEEHRTRCACTVPRGESVSHTRAAVVHWLGLLRRWGEIPPKEAAPKDAVAVILETFETHLGETCGASPGTRRCYLQLLTTFYNTGARVSEIIALRTQDAQLDHNVCLHLHGKGRKERSVPLWKTTATMINQWLRQAGLRPGAPLFPNRDGTTLSRSGVEKRLRAAVVIAAERCPSLRQRRISPHILRHTTAMHLLQSGVDITVIALWLGHESPATTHQYLEADLSMKEQALKRVEAPPWQSHRFRPSDHLLAFLDGL
jgi:integrase